jgi:hypothetical protein
MMRGRSISSPYFWNKPAFHVTIIGPAPWPIVANPAVSGIRFVIKPYAPDTRALPSYIKLDRA